MCIAMARFLPRRVAHESRLTGRILVAGWLVAVAGAPAYAQQAVNLPPALRAALDRSVASRPQIRVTDAEGREITAETRARVGNGTVLLATPPTRPYVVRLNQVERMAIPADRERVALPGGLVVPGPQGTAPVWFQLTIGASPSPAVWDGELRRYTTRLWLGLRASDHAAPDLVPGRPVSVRLGFIGLTAENVEPLQLERPGLEHELPVDLHFLPTTASPTLQVRSTLTDVDFTLDVPARLELRPVHREMPGLGLGTVGIVVAHVLPHGEPAPAPGTLPVSLTIEGRATPDPQNPEIPDGAAETRFTLRSSGLGDVTVHARAGALTDTTTVRQFFPIGPWLASLLGGCLGGFARSFVPKARRRSTRRRVLEGLVVSQIVYVASVLGVANAGLPAVVAATEAGAFLTGALAGFAGVVAIEWVSGPKPPARATA